MISSEISLFASKTWGYSVLRYHVIITVDRPVVILLLINPRVHPKITIFKLFLTIRLQTVKSNNEFRIGPDSVFSNLVPPISNVGNVLFFVVQNSI